MRASLVSIGASRPTDRANSTLGGSVVRRVVPFEVPGTDRQMLARFYVGGVRRDAPDAVPPDPGLFRLTSSDQWRRLPHMSSLQAARSPALPVRLAISWLTNALVLAIVAAVLRGVTVKDAGALLAAAAVFGVLNTLLKPLLRFITLPLAILSFGIAWFFVSLLMLVVTKAIVGGFHIHGFWTLVEATLIVWVVNLVLDFVPGPWQVTGKRRRRREQEAG